MNDTITQKRIDVVTDDDAESYITLPLEQLDRVTTVLDANHIPYWVDDESLSIDGKPPIIDIHLSFRCDPVKVQRLLDGIS